MAQLSVAEAWVERVNKNLLPLLNKFSIRRQGPFGLSNVIQPIVNVETLEEVQAASQQRALITGTLSAVNSFISLLVPVAEVWSVEFVAAGSGTGSVSAARDIFTLLVGGVPTAMKGDFPDTGVTVRQTGFAHSFNPPIVLVAGEGFTLQRVVLGGSSVSNIRLFFRRV